MYLYHVQAQLVAKNGMSIYIFNANSPPCWQRLYTNSAHHRVIGVVNIIQKRLWIINSSGADGKVYAVVFLTRSTHLVQTAYRKKSYYFVNRIHCYLHLV